MKTIFEDQAIGIRPFWPNDAEALFLAACESKEDLCRWMVWCRPDYDRNDSRAFIAKSQTEWQESRSFDFAIYATKDGELLGSIGLKAVDHVHRFANLGYWVRSQRTLEGIASAAVRLAAVFAFEELGLNRLELVIPVENLRSTRVAERAGANREGVLKCRVVLNGSRHDAVMYALLNDSLA